jgi:hypothetical protein
MKILTHTEINEISGGGNLAITLLGVASFINLLIGLSNSSMLERQGNLMVDLGMLTIAHELQLSTLPGYTESKLWIEAQNNKD